MRARSSALHSARPNFLPVTHPLILDTTHLVASALRMLRVLRPLRSITHVHSLKIVVTALITSAPALAYTMLLYLFVLCFFAEVFLSVFVGAFDNQCRGSHLAEDDRNYYEAEAYCSPYTEPCDTGFGLFHPYDCDGNLTACVGEHPAFYPSFDSFGEAFMTLYRVGSFDHLGDAVWHTQNAKGPIVIILYIVFVVVGPCVVSNVCIAAIIKNFNDAQTEAIAEASAKQKREQELRAANNPGGNLTPQSMRMLDKAKAASLQEKKAAQRAMGIYGHLRECLVGAATRVFNAVCLTYMGSKDESLRRMAADDSR